MPTSKKRPRKHSTLLRLYIIYKAWSNSSVKTVRKCAQKAGAKLISKKSPQKHSTLLRLYIIYKVWSDSSIKARVV